MENKDFALCLIILLFIVSLIACLVESEEDTKRALAQPQTTRAERVDVMMRLCFPEGEYTPEASPLCSSFKNMVIKELDAEQVKQTTGDENAE